MPATLEKRELTPEEICEARIRDRDQARLAWQTAKRDTLSARVRHERLYARNCWTWTALKEIKRELEARMITCLDVVQNPGEMVSGATWTAAAERVEAARAELDAVKGAFRRLGAQMADIRKTLTAMGEWLDKHPDCPDYERRSRLMLAEFGKLAELDGWPSDCPEDRKRLMGLAALNGYPAIPTLRVRGSAAGWSCLLASACTVAELRAAMEAIRAN